MFLAGDVSEPVANLLSFLIVGAIVGGVGASLVMKAINTLKNETPIPTKTAETQTKNGSRESLMKNEEVHDTEDRSSTEIASDIRERRNRMDATLDELSNQFTVRSIVNSALDWWANRQVHDARRRSGEERLPKCGLPSEEAPSSGGVSCYRYRLDDH